MSSDQTEYSPDNWPAARWTNFSYKEIACQHCGRLALHDGSMDNLQRLRTSLGSSIRITSGYRCPDHPIEAVKERPGSHSKGRAFDIACSGGGADKIIRLSYDAGFTRRGVSQSNGDRRKRFIHLDTAGLSMVWSY